MVKNFIVCGSHSFPREEEDEEYYYTQQRQVQSAGSSPLRSCKTSRRNNSSSSSHKNPYSDRGLDKFSALLADIEEKREKIYSQFPPEEISFVQFDFSKDNNGKPIVVKGKPPRSDHDHEDKKTTRSKTFCRKHHSGPLDDRRHQPAALEVPKPKEKTTTTTTTTTTTDEVVVVDGETAVDQKNSCELQLAKIQHFNLEKMRKPGCYLSATVILILIFLALFGRSVAIMCTSIGWYMMSTVSSNSAGGQEFKKRSHKKKKVLQMGQLNSKLASAPVSFKGVNYNHQIRSGSPPPPSAATKCGLRKNRP